MYSTLLAGLEHLENSEEVRLRGEESYRAIKLVYRPYFNGTAHPKGLVHLQFTATAVVRIEEPHYTYLLGAIPLASFGEDDAISIRNVLYRSAEARTQIHAVL